jgi:hypothetical protein
MAGFGVVIETYHVSPVRNPSFMQQRPAAVKTNTLTQLSFELQHWSNQLPKALPPLLRQRGLLGQLSAGWLLAGLVLLLLWVWIWQWLLSIAVGATVMVGIYLAQERRLNLSWQGWNWMWSRANRSLTLSGLMGSVGLGSTYLATAVWQESQQPWLATCILLEGGGILAILGLLVWQMLHQRDSLSMAQFQTMLADLSHQDALKRLIAVRQLTQWFDRTTTELPTVAMTPAQLAECFRLMLDCETEPLVCSALLESLRQLHPTRQLEGSPAVAVHLKQKASGTADLNHATVSAANQ